MVPLPRYGTWIGMFSQRRKGCSALLLLFCAFFVYISLPNTLRHHLSLLRLRGVEDEQNTTDAFTLITDNEGNETPGRNVEVEQMKSIVQRPQHPQIILFFSGWRSGSTFICDMIARASDGAFYSYEPLAPWGIQVMTEDVKETREARKFLNSMIHCDLDEHYKEVRYLLAVGWWYKNFGYVKRCNQTGVGQTIVQHSKSFRNAQCGNVTFYQEVCKTSDVHVSKVLRLGLKWSRDFLLDPSVNVSVVYMIRDPRATMASRMPSEFCSEDAPTCSDPAVVCSNLQEDLSFVPSLRKEFPERFVFVNYERLSQKPEDTFKKILESVHLPMSSQVINEIRENGKARTSVGDIHTRRNTEKHIELWRENLNFTSMLKIQKECKEVLRLLGFREFTTKKEYQDLDISSVLPHAPLLQYLI